MALHRPRRSGPFEDRDTALAEGKSLEEAAARLGISPHTARTQVKNAFAKTGTSRQAQLVALVLRSVAALRQA